MAEVLNAHATADYVNPPDIIAVAKRELTEEQFTRFLRSRQLGAAYVQFITEERHVAGLRATTEG